jgi:hypothetical protein
MSGRAGRRTRGLLLLLVLASACTSVVPPRARVLAPLDPGLGRVLYVTTTDARENVLADLKQAGFQVASDARETPLVLVVKLGNVRSRRKCGSLRNVVYELRQVGVLVAVIKGRGWTGACDPSILRDMNAVLARLFDSSLSRHAGRRPEGG